MEQCLYNVFYNMIKQYFSSRLGESEVCVYAASVASSAASVVSSAAAPPTDGVTRIFVQNIE